MKITTQTRTVLKHFCALPTREEQNTALQAITQLICSTPDKVTETELAALSGNEAHNNGRKWTPEEESEIRRLFLEGNTPHRIASATGRTPGAVHSRLLLIAGKEPRREWTPEETASLKEALSSRTSTHTIARGLGISPLQVLLRIRDLSRENAEETQK